MKMSLNKAFWMLVFVFTLSACGDQRELVQFQGSTMGTYYSIKLIKQEGLPAATDMQAEIDRRLELVNDQMSTYRKHSELSQFNQSRSTEPFTVSADTAKVVKEAIRLSKLTDGALDVTVGPIVNLWSFGPEARPEKTPTADELEVRREIVGIEHLSVEGNALRKAIPELYVDLSSIAKGFGVDVIADYFDDLNIADYLVEVGGELRLKGKNQEGVAWRIAIEKPTEDGSRAIQEVIEPGDMAVATSGDYRNYFEENGVRYSHLIDPNTGHPIDNHVVSVTVLDESCMTADALATAFSVMGEEKALALANQEGLPVLLIVKTEQGFTEFASDAFAPYMKQK
ncbi:FAD:protein FMN transferase [Photobacterium ganghwense]|uniref:FAD:protein FMN transferase n=1 Tax=Photobacterium ganghwense TaxID=320778 RepID=A0A0J1HHH1_9GAMM|nr:FAD:protein FMN transferase [Photobacterium ganghwense]KLV11071.1 thiamine biosynthesis lipoprotein [Photobacterium ganghwense]PSU11336.1 FAD:protein FMN transferase [Photobacterium ganghwense]QSV13461.1 FAD:protein FMN transferase [Photobacterium ganghwense]